MSTDLLALAPIWYVAFLFSTVCHEAAHALVAKWGGDDTAYAGGQVSLDPIPHIRREPIGLVAVPILTLLMSGAMIGWGSAPFNPYWQIRYPRRAALMALAGPATNFLIAIAAGVLIRAGIAAHLFIGSESLGLAGAGGFGDALATFLNILFFLNVLLGVFNLLPFPPLDGYTVLGLVLPEDLALKLIEGARTPGFAMIGMLVAWKIFPVLLSPVYHYAWSILFFF